ncbi:unnamed protein product [Ceutorhynchus assimilis]|uniref:Uncharacterized protein n=1 Tax=Ceutorhynchus assimilis TaxID=467358 RepID=A0A9N9MB37_9CUCU|nr:unnamed protein product [Ceutorhynchus assimilis]
MDEDIESKTWVLVNEVDCAEEALTLNPTVGTATDSDQESDGSISIITDHPSESHSEEEHEPVMVSGVKPIIPIVTIDAAPEITDEDICIEYSVSDFSNTSKQELSASQYSEKNETEHEINECHVTPTFADLSKKNWAYDDGELKFEPSHRPFFLDCSQEPILEVSQIETEANTENISNLETFSINPESQTLVQKLENVSAKIQTKQPGRYETFTRIRIGILLSMMVLVGSHLIQQYNEYKDDEIQTRSERFLEGLVEHEKAKEIVNFCTDRQKAKGEYSERALEKCVIKRLRKKNREEKMHRTEIYLQMKERMLELRERELNEKEKQVLKQWWKTQEDACEKKEIKKDKWWKFQSDASAENSNEESINKNSYLKLGTSFDEFDTKYKEQFGFKEKKRYNLYKEKIFQKEHPYSKKNQFIRGKDKENNKFTEEVFDKHYNKYIPKNNKANEKIFKTSLNNRKVTLKTLKGKIKKKYQQDNRQQKQRKSKGDKTQDSDEDWYIKYNPSQNTIELINITKLSPEDSSLIRNGNKTINGQWYFSLYGDSRNNIRNKEKIAEWYFRRGYYRENKRDKAKWYFDYMSGRNHAEYF